MHWEPLCPHARAWMQALLVIVAIILSTTPGANAFHMGHGQVLHHVWYRNGTLWSNDSTIENEPNANFFSFPIRYAPAAAFADHTVHAGPALVFGKDYNWRVWYHLLFDASLPVLAMLHGRYNLLSDDASRSDIHVAFANRQEERLVPVFYEFWHLFSDDVWTDGETWDRSREARHGAESALYYGQVVFVSKHLPYPQLTSEALPLMELLRSQVQRRLLHHHQTNHVPTSDTLLITRKGTRAFGDGVEERVHQLLTRHGLDVTVTQMGGSFYKQWAMMHAAKLVVAGHGSALTNAVWMQPGCVLIELFPHAYADPLYRSMTTLLGNRYFTVHGDPTDLDYYTPFPCEQDQGLTFEIRKQDCVPGSPFMERLCCFMVWRDQPILLKDMTAVETAVQHARDGTYHPQCTEGDVIVTDWSMFTCG